MLIKIIYCQLAMISFVSIIGGVIIIIYSIQGYYEWFPLGIIDKKTGLIIGFSLLFLGECSFKKCRNKF